MSHPAIESERVVPGTCSVWAEDGRVWLQHRDAEGEEPPRVLFSFAPLDAETLAARLREAAAEANLQAQRAAGFVHCATVVVDAKELEVER